MAGDESFHTLTAEFGHAALAERASLEHRIKDLRDRAAQLDAQATAVATELSASCQALRTLDLVLGIEPQLDLDDSTHTLHGERLRRVAIDLLSQRAPQEPVHYKQWYKWLVEQGYTVGGRDPLATFLVAISRAPTIERIGSRSGRYRLRAA